jgi:hypothetical protein
MGVSTEIAVLAGLIRALVFVGFDRYRFEVFGFKNLSAV